MEQRRLKYFLNCILIMSLVLGFFPWLAAPQVQAEEAAAAEEDDLLSQNRPAYASSTLGNSTPDLVVDGKTDTRWESVWQQDPQWLYVDLGAEAKLSRVEIEWENAYSKEFEIQVSDDGENWNPVLTETDGQGGLFSKLVSGEGRYVRVFSTKRAQEAYGLSIWEFRVYGTGGIKPQPEAPNLALNKPVTVSSLEKEEEGKENLSEKDYLAANATDGDASTRWSSAHKNNEWIYVDLGETSEIGSIVLNWEAAYGKAYDIQVSDDARSWTTIYRELWGSGGKESIPLYAKGRYVKMLGIARGSEHGYSLFEFEVHAYREGDEKPVYTIPDIPSPESVNVGAGSYEINDITQLEPKNPKYRTEDVVSPIPSNDWWQSLLISRLGDSNGLITLPFKNKYTKLGLAILNPGEGYASANGASIDADGDPDLFLLPNTINPSEMETKVSGYGDYSANVILSDDGTAKMSTTFVKGSPYIYNTFANPDAIILQSPVITGLFDDNGKPVLENDGDTLTADHIGIKVTNKDRAPVPQTFDRYYGVFAPPGTVFTRLGSNIKMKLGSGGDYLSIATLPSAAELPYFYQHAYAFVKDTRVDYSFDQESSTVSTRFNSITEQKRTGFSSDTLMALLPHQWKITSSSLTELTYPSIRGTLKVHEGNTFTTSDRFYGIVPQFAEPDDPTYSRAQLSAYLDLLDADLTGNNMIEDPYWQGKKLHPLALAVIISDQIGDEERKEYYLGILRDILTDWYTYSEDEPQHSYYFHYSPEWGAIFPYHSGFGVNTGLTDHHFTYGYYVFASAVLASYDESFLNDYGDMVEVLIRDYANPSKTDDQFPWMRNFDPYEGHSWAGGYADNPSGNNQEAGGEALFGWVGQYMWGMVTGNNAYRDAGIWGFTTEEKAIEQYWFNYDHDNWTEGYKHAIAGQVYGSAYLFGTFFSGDPQHIYGIHWLPPAEWMTYYGRDPEKAKALYEGMVQDNNGPENTWQHLIWPFESISDAQAVLTKWDTTAMQKNEVFNAYWFVHSMATLGTRTMDIWANDPGVTVYNSVYENGEGYIAQVWNPSNSEKTFVFYNAQGETGSTTVYPGALVTVDPTEVTTVEPDTNSGIVYLDRSNWTVTTFSDSSPEAGKLMFDNDLSTRWTSERAQSGTEWIEVDLGAPQSFDTLFINAGTSGGDYARAYEVYVSDNGQDWGEAIASGVGNSASIATTFPLQNVRYIKIAQTGTADSWWSISELKTAKMGKNGGNSGGDTTSPAKGELTDHSLWTVTTSTYGNQDIAANMLDGDLATRWTSGQDQTNGQWIQLDLGKTETFDTVTLNPGSFTEDYPDSYRVYVSNDNKKWNGPVASGQGAQGDLTITFPIQNARYLKIVQTGQSSKWWSIAEFSIFHYGTGKQTELSRSGWSMTASSTAADSSKTGMLDGDTATRWSTGKPQEEGQWIELDLGTVQSFNQIVMDSRGSAEDYARGYQLLVSRDGETWGSPVVEGKGAASKMTLTFPAQTARYIKVIQTGTDSRWWSISEFRVLARDARNQDDAIAGVLDREAWTVTASVYGSESDETNMQDGNLHTRWTSGENQTEGQWLQLDLGDVHSFRQISMDSGSSRDDYARGYQIFVSNDASAWELVAEGEGTSRVVTPKFRAQNARYIRIVQTGEAEKWWSIAELNVFK
ncbi:discoidin domain-containing protein [Paenibacillus medicaginis]|uniref:glucan endo-1,3-beta-D-glucosidase n=1 Tax=Paenibacillus medicaginis TaxID=1470560 RepID=A0ABV5C094_9BACL